MGERLSVETQNATMREWLAGHHTRIVDEELHGEIVGAVDDEIIFLDDVECVRRVEECVMGFNFHVGVDGLDFLFGTLHLRHTHVLREMNHLSLQV